MLCLFYGSVNFCRELFDDLGVFAKYSGLKPNILKTQAFWAGQREDGDIHTERTLRFKWSKKVQVLGVVFANDGTDAHEDNFESKLRHIQSLMNSWKRRYITIRGKITLLETLMLPKLTHILVSLPKPSISFEKKNEYNDV